MINVLQIANGYFSNRLFYHLFQKLKNEGINNTIYVPMNKNDSQAPNPEDIPYDIYLSARFKDIDRVLFFRKQYIMLREIESKIHLDEIDICHAHTVFSNGYIAYKLKRKYNIPYVVAVRNTDINVFFKYMIHLRKIGLHILKDASSIIFLSNSYKSQLFETFIPQRLKDDLERKSVVIPNGIDDFWHENTYYNKEYDTVLERIRHKEIKLIYAGVIDNNKNLEFSCEAVRQLKNRGWRIEFLVVGRVKERKVYNSIKDNVIYIEPVPKEKLIDLYRKADIFVMPSLTESFGLVYVEAMSQGLPVIYTKGQGFDGQFPEGTVGYHVNSRHIEDMVSAIERIALDYERISRNTLVVFKKFQWKSIANNYSKIYEHIIKD